MPHSHKSAGQSLTSRPHRLKRLWKAHPVMSMAKPPAHLEASLILQRLFLVLLQQSAAAVLLKGDAFSRILSSTLLQYARNLPLIPRCLQQAACRQLQSTVAANHMRRANPFLLPPAWDIGQASHLCISMAHAFFPFSPPNII